MSTTSDARKRAAERDSLTPTEVEADRNAAEARAAGVNRDELREAIGECLFENGPDAVTDLDLADALIAGPLAGLLAENAGLREAVKPALQYVGEKGYTTLFGDFHANDVRLVLRDLTWAAAERDRLRATIEQVRELIRDPLRHSVDRANLRRILDAATPVAPELQVDGDEATRVGADGEGDR